MSKRINLEPTVYVTPKYHVSLTVVSMVHLELTSDSWIVVEPCYIHRDRVSDLIRDQLGNMVPDLIKSRVSEKYEEKQPKIGMINHKK